MSLDQANAARLIPTHHSSDTLIQRISLWASIYLLFQRYKPSDIGIIVSSGTYSHVMVEYHWNYIGIPLQGSVYQLRDPYMALSSNWHTSGHFSISAWRTMVLQLLCEMYIYTWHAMLNNRGEDDFYTWETRHNTFSVVRFRHASICRRFERLKSVIYLFTCILEKTWACGQKSFVFYGCQSRKTVGVNSIKYCQVLYSTVQSCFLQVLTQRCSSSSSSSSFFPQWTHQLLGGLL